MKITIESEMSRRMNMVNSSEFRAECASMAKQTGISPEEWESNKAAILMMFANQFCSMENENGIQLTWS